MRHLTGLASVLVVALAAILVITGIDGVKGYRGMVGARREVKDVKSNKEIQDLGRFSVNEFNSNLAAPAGTQKQLRFEEVIKAQTQVVSGIKYYLKIIAADSNKELGVYDAAVVVKPWLNHRSVTLLHFRPSSSTSTTAKAAV